MEKIEVTEVEGMQMTFDDMGFDELTPQIDSSTNQQ